MSGSSPTTKEITAAAGAATVGAKKKMTENIDDDVSIIAEKRRDHSNEESNDKCETSVKRESLSPGQKAQKAMKYRYNELPEFVNDDEERLYFVKLLHPQDGEACLIANDDKIFGAYGIGRLAERRAIRKKTLVNEIDPLDEISHSNSSSVSVGKEDNRKL